MLELALRDLAATDAFAGRVAGLATRRDVIALHGSLGAGKTAFARAFINARANMPVEVLSPTFTLVQTYALAYATVWHFDLYRVATPEEIHELGFDEAREAGVSLIEWAKRLGALLPADRLDIHFDFADVPNARRARVMASGAWAERIGGLEADGDD